MSVQSGVPSRSNGAVGTRVPVKVVAATVAGNALEFFDFIAYNFFAVYIGKAFFPASNPVTSLLLSVGVFGVGFLFRPLGGVLIGAYADRVGRRPAMLLTIVLITIGTLGLALTPSYAAIGIAAPIIVVICRLVQGLALGGEVGPASVFLIEIAPPERRAFYSSWQLASQGLAALAASGLGMVLSITLPSADLESWGWRIPFLLCVVLVPVALYLRRAMPETLEQGAASLAARTPSPERPGLGMQVRFILLAIVVILGGTVSTYAANYMTTYGLTTLHFPPSSAFAATVIGGFCTFAFSLIGGWLADSQGRRAMMILPRLVLTVVTWPLFLLLTAYPSPFLLYVTTAAMTALTALSGAALFAAIPELLPRSIRATGVAVGYAVGVSIFGGSTQFVITWLLKVTHNPTSPAWYVTATSLVSLVAMLSVPESRHRRL